MGQKQAQGGGQKRRRPSRGKRSGGGQAQRSA